MSSKEKRSSIFTKILINHKVPLEFRYVNRLLTDNILEYLKKRFEGKCCEQGYIKPDSINIVNYSSGIVKNNLIIFDVVFESQVCYLVEGLEVNCVAKNITKAGIRAEFDMEKTPAVIFVARDHHYVNKKFNEVEEGNIITVKIIGQRYELNDTNISAIAELVKVSKTSKKLLIEEDVSKNSSKTTSKTSSKTSVKSNPKTSAEPEPEAVAEPEPEAVAEPEPEAVAEPEPEAVAEPEPEAAAEPEPEAAVEPEPEAAVEPEPEAAVEPEPEAADEEEEALKALELLDKEIELDMKKKEAEKDTEKKSEKELEKEKEVTIVPDTKPPVKRPRGRPRKNPQ